jgi:hypothetical protein
VDRLDGVFRYAGDRYDEMFVRHLADRYGQLTRAVVANPEAPLREVVPLG